MHRMHATSRATSVNSVTLTAAGFRCKTGARRHNGSMKTVAVIGASYNRGKYGNKALRAFERQGFHVIAINPNEREVEGHRTYAPVLDVPEAIDMATVYVPPDVGVHVMDDLAMKGIPEVWLNPGADDP